MTRRITIDDLHNIRLVADPNISPDGLRVAYVVTTVDREINGYRSAIWMAGTQPDSQSFQFTGGQARDSYAR